MRSPHILLLRNEQQKHRQFPNPSRIPQSLFPFLFQPTALILGAQSKTVPSPSQKIDL